MTKSKLKTCTCISLLVICSACATYNFLPETSKKYPKNQSSQVGAYSFEKCPPGTKIGKINYEGMFIIPREQALKGAIRKSASIGADFICYNPNTASYSDYIAFVRLDNNDHALKVIHYKIKVISQPSGANIEMNHDYRGKTPLTLTVQGNSRGNFVDSINLTALPVINGHCTQNKHFSSLDKIPHVIFFDTRLCPLYK